MLFAGVEEILDPHHVREVDRNQPRRQIDSKRQRPTNCPRCDALHAAQIRTAVRHSQSVIIRSETILIF